MKKIIISGEDREVDKIICENRIRVDRGLISFNEVGKKGRPNTKSLDNPDTKELKDIKGKADTDV